MDDGKCVTCTVAGIVFCIFFYYYFDLSGQLAVMQSRCFELLVLYILSHSNIQITT